MAESVNHPSHYKQGGMEVIDVIEAFTQECTASEAFYIGNVIKYVCRFKKKNGVEDLKKARWYLDRLIENHETAEKEDFECKRKKVLDALQKRESE
jgi:hypothetical protein